MFGNGGAKYDELLSQCSGYVGDIQGRKVTAQHRTCAGSEMKP